MTNLQKQTIWNIDFCEDNLCDSADAAESVKQLKELLVDHRVNYTEQRCIHACRPCHEGALIVRLNDELITGSTSGEVVNAIVALIKQAK